MKLHAGCNQRIPEYHSWVSLVGGMRAKSYVELGCGSAHFMSLVGVERIVTVDLLPNGLGEGTSTHLQADSHDPSTLSRVLEMLGGPPDVVFIDADHESPAVLADFALWYPVARLAVGFHDIRMPSVIPAWEDLALRYPSVEIVARDIVSANVWQHGGHSPDGRVGCGGIGVIFKEDA